MSGGRKKALIAMSGGVDSSVAAKLMKERGFECVGAMMKLYGGGGGGRSCCGLEDSFDARAVCDKIGIPFYVFNFTEDFEERVVKKFVASYKRAETPNPCVDCNRYMKFERFARRAEEIGCDYIVTGHYARVERSGGRFLLKKGADGAKDQSYALYTISRERLARTLFPIGELTKREAREIAAAAGFANARKRDSQDVCFIPDGDCGGFIESFTGEKFPEGDFIDADGKVIGRHKGIIRYTVGQRKGLGVTAPAPLYVRKIDPAANTVTLCADEELFSKTLEIDDINLIAADDIDGRLRAKVKIRYSHAEQPAFIERTGADRLRIEFDEPQRAVTSGQAAVIYDGDTVIGGGRII
ncbi:MAG: tRNA 2-thiouridine(34) synthase MnmA [Clostridiales bacterium]|jgi:tRNA-specific 2-thiouridylase|nr:tRNA 2-thiouridine(34) synthase MnmA [Clostridiales bacterium]